MNIFKVIKKIASIGGILLLCLFVLFSWGRSCSTPPKDADLILQFHKNRETFEQLKHMMREDLSVYQIASFGVELENDISARPIKESPFPEERYNSYMKKLKNAGVSRVIRAGEELRFQTEGWGFAGKGWRIGLAYRKTPPENTISNMDDFRKSKSDMEQAYRAIEDDWYILMVW